MNQLFKDLIKKDLNSQKSYYYCVMTLLSLSIQIYLLKFLCLCIIRCVIDYVMHFVLFGLSNMFGFSHIF